MKRPSFKLKPASKSSSAVHVLLNILLASLMLLFIRDPITLPILAVALFLLSKWRMLSVRPRFWFANIRSNIIDIAVGLSVIVFWSGTNDLFTQLVWLALYVLWLLVVKPRSSNLAVAFQALLGQTLALIALHGSYSDSPIVLLVVLTWVICYGSARHFFSTFEDENGTFYSHIWGLFGAQLAWVLAHWQLGYAFIPQIVLLLTVVGYAMAFCYYLHMTRGLKSGVRNQFISFTLAIVVLVVLFSEWQYSGI